MSRLSEVQVRVCTHRREFRDVRVSPGSQRCTSVIAPHLRICSQSLRCAHPQRHVLVYRVCAHMRPLNVCVCTSSGRLCVHRPRDPRADPRFFSLHRPHHLGEALLKAHLSSFPPAGPLARTHTCTQTLQGMHTHTQSHSGVHTHAHTRRVRSALTHVGAHSCSYTYSYTQRYTRSYT